jgi:hypothetical protein
MRDSLVLRVLYVCGAYTMCCVCALRVILLRGVTLACVRVACCVRVRVMRGAVWCHAHTSTLKAVSRSVGVAWSCACR